MQTTRHIKDDDLAKHKHTISDDLGRLAEDARALVSDTVDVAGETARKRLAVAIDSGKEVYDRVREKTLQRAKVADQVIRENPYRTIGIALGVGTLLGFFLARRR
jgi:ElaB/YqjD/DUF883 family membrane-anchored ribosome-binding protein